MDSYLDNTTDKANALKAELDKTGHTDSNTKVTANDTTISIEKFRGKDKILDVSTGTISEPLTVAKAISAGTVFNEKNTPLTDEYGNTFIVPKGFKISSDSAEVVTEGIVIEDATYTSTKGSEFVWIPVSKDSTDKNKVKGAKNTTILLSRYTFDGSGNQTNQGANTIDSYFTELASSSYGNAVAKTDVTSVNGFIAKTNAAGGFWIGRYEARTTSSTARSSSSDPLTAVTEKPEYSVYNYIKQTDASAKAIAMYDENDYFQSDLINSYAWDTAILFLQEYDNRTYNINSNSNYKAKYSRQISLSSGLKNTGTNASSVADTNKDKICNVYDMADNCFEWTTETASGSDYPCVRRGGNFYNSYSYTSNRGLTDTTNARDSYSFRPVLYVK